MSGAYSSPILNAVVSSLTSAPAAPSHAKDLSHHNGDGKGFINPWPSYTDRGGFELGFEFFKWKITGKGRTPDTTPPTVPVRRPTFLPSRQTHKLRATWLGHACYYVEFTNGLRILFDPVFTERCSPLSWLGPKRYTDMPCQIKDIPIIDAVVISHNHYDHLSHPTILEIQKRHPNCHFFAPLGNKKWFEDNGVKNSTELDWWQSVRFSLSEAGPEKTAVQADVESTAASEPSGDMEAIIGCLPCQHTSARSGWDKSMTLWASWSIEAGGKNLYFGGDTGYRSVPQGIPATEDDYDPKYDLPHCPAFKEIGEHRGPFDLGLIPIGAYDPRWFMSPMHANPFDSVNIFQDTRCERALGIHWGTWVLTEEDVLEPPKLLKQALAKKGIAEEGVFDVCDIGESREY